MTGFVFEFNDWMCDWMETNEKMIWRFDAWVSGSSCIPSIVGRMRRRGKKLKEEKNRIVEEVVEGVSTIRSGKRRKVSSKGKRKKKGK